MISFDNFDTEPPSNYREDEYDEATTDLPSSRLTQSSLQILLYRSLQIRLEILNSSSGIKTYPRTTTFYKSIPSYRSHAI